MVRLPLNGSHTVTTHSNDDAALREFDTLPDAAFVRIGTVARLYSATPASVWRWVKRDGFPQPRKLGPQVTAWNVGEVRRHLTQLQAAG